MAACERLEDRTLLSAVGPEDLAGAAAGQTLEIGISPVVDEDRIPPVDEERIPSQIPTSDAAPPFDPGETFLLHSNPGATKVIYLDFDGHTTTGTAWTNSVDPGSPIVTPAYSFEGDVSSNFTDGELERIQRIWQRVAEDFIPFDVNVTTQDPGTEALRNTGGGDSEWGVRVAIGGSSSDWYGSGAGGVAYMGVFGITHSNYRDAPAFVFENNLGDGHEKFTTEAISHEVGHTLGLHHDGTPVAGSDYYQGHGSGATGWAPIMGVGYYQALSQWSQGEYSGADETEDDLQIITTQNGFGYRTDDHGGSDATASLATWTGDTLGAEGIIERNDDVDVFSFTTTGGQLDLDVLPFVNSPNLDILAELYDSVGGLVAVSNPLGALNASFNLTLAAGDYFLRIDGTGEGDPLATGYTDYGSLGAYTITGILGSPQRYDSTDVSKQIPNEDTITSTLTINDDLVIDDINVGLNIGHPNVPQLDVFLISPDGIRVELFTDVGDPYTDNFTNTVLDDEAHPITNGSAPFIGSFAPEGSLTDFDGRLARGIWTLEITDDERGIVEDGGILNSWFLDILPRPEVSLTVTISPSTISEIDGSSATTGTVTRTGDLSQDLIVQLTSSDPSEAAVPATVTILADQASAMFNISAVDDNLIDGMQTVTISAHVGGSLLADLTYGTNGVALVPDLRVQDAVRQSDGKLVVAGWLIEGIGTPDRDNDVLVARFNADGTLDTGFGGGDGMVVIQAIDGTDRTENAFAVSVQGDGKIIVGGELFTAGEATQHDKAAFLVRLDTNGEYDGTFSTDGRVVFNPTTVLDKVWDLLVLPDNSILAAGEHGGGAALYHFASDGTLLAFPNGSNQLFVLSVPSDDPNPTGVGDDATTLVLQPDGKILVGGFVYGDYPNRVWGIARLTADFQYDDTFGTDGRIITDLPTTTEHLHQLALQPDGKIVAVGGGGSGTYANEFQVLARYNSDGSLDDSFGDGGSVVTALADDAVGHAVHVLPDGSILVAGSGGGNGQGALTRYTPAGVLIASATTLLESFSGKSILAEPDGQVLVVSGSGTAVERFSLLPFAADTASVNVTDDDTAPQAVADGAVTDEDSAVVINVLANDIDADGDPLTVISVTNPPGGTATNNGDGTITYTPDENFNGTDSFTYTIRDADGLRDTATVSITINPINEAPLAVDDNATTAEETAVIINVLANDSDANGDTLTVTSVSNAFGGTAAINANGTITFTPDDNFNGPTAFNGPASFTYTISDGNGGTDTGTVSITVSPVNDAPTVAVNNPLTVAEDGTATITNSLLRVTDVDDLAEDLTFFVTTYPDHGRLLINGQTFFASDTFTQDDINAGRLTYEHFGNELRSDFFRATYSDGQSPPVDLVFDINVTPTNDPPVAEGDVATAIQGAPPLVVDVLANDTDYDGDPLTITSVSFSSGGTATITDNGTTVTFTPESGYAGTTRFHYTVRDGNGGTSQGLVRLIVYAPAEIEGTVWDDADGDGTRDAGEPGLADRTVYLDLNDNGTRDATSTIELDPDDFEYRTELTDILPQATLSAIDGSGNVVAAVGAFDHINQFTGNNVFGHESDYGAEDILWRTGFRELRIDFHVSVRSVSIDSTGPGLLEIYDAAGNLLGTTTSDGTFDTMTLSATTDIAYAIAAGDTSYYTYLDNLRFTTTTPEPTATTDANGNYAFTGVVPGEYVVRQITPQGVTQTAPNNANGYFYGIYDTRLYKIDAVTGDFKLIGPPNQQTRMDGLAYTNSGELFGIKGGGLSDELYQVDLETGVVTLIGPTGLDVGWGLAYDHETDTLYGVGRHADGTTGLIVYDRSTGAATPIGQGVANLNGTSGVAFDAAGNRVIVFNNTGNEFHAFDAITGAATLLTSAFNAEGFGFTETGTALVMHQSNGNAPGERLVTVNPDTGTFSHYLTLEDAVTSFQALEYVAADPFAHHIEVGPGQTAVATDFGNQGVNAPNAPPSANPDSFTVDEDGTLTIGGTGTPVLDQENFGSTGGYVFHSGYLSLQQQVRAGESGQLMSVDVFIEQSSDPGDMLSLFVSLGAPWQNDTPEFQTQITVESADIGNWITIDVSAANVVLQEGDLFTIGTSTVGLSGVYLLTTNSDFGGDSYVAGSLWVDGTRRITPGDNDYDLLFRTRMAPVALNGLLANDTDADGDPLTAVLVTGPAHGALQLNADGSFTYTPDANYSGTDSFTYKANDGQSDSNVATVSITVNAANDAPVAGNDTATTNEDTAVVIDVLPNDTDAEGDTLTIISVSDPAGGTARIANNGTVIIFTPDANVHGTTRLLYTISDGNGGTDSATVSITVNSINDPPVADRRGVSTDEDIPLTDVLTATDADGDPLTFSIGRQPRRGTVTVQSDGTFTYTPEANFNYIDSFGFWVSDGTTRDFGEVTISINAVDDVPVAVDDQYQVDEDGTLSVIATGISHLDLVSEPGDYIGQGQTYYFSTGDGKFTKYDINNDNSFHLEYFGHGNLVSLELLAPFNERLVPGTYAGATRYPFQDNDDPGLSVTMDSRGSNTLTGEFTVYQAVYDANGNLVNFLAEFEQHNEGDDPALLGTVEYNAVPNPAAGVLANDTEVDGEKLTVTLVDDVAHGTLILNANGTFSYTPDANYSGTDSFTYRVSDGTTVSNIATITMTVNAVNDPPVADPSSFSMDEDIAHSGNVTGADPDSATLTYAVAAGPAHGVLNLNADGTFTYTPQANYFGTDSFTFTVSDGTSTSTPATVSISVIGVNDAPTFDASSYDFSVAENSVGGTAVGTASASDVDNQPLNYSIIGGNDSGAFAIDAATGAITVADASKLNFETTENVFSLTVRASDAMLADETTVVVISLEDIPAPAVASVEYGYGDNKWATPESLAGRTAPWKITQIRIRFTQDVTVDINDLTVTGTAGEYEISDISYDDETFTAIWTLSSPIEQDRVTIALDGDSAAAGGDGNEGVHTGGEYLSDGDLLEVLDVLLGDADGNRRVDFNDMFATYQGIGQPYDPDKDINGDGRVDFNDLFLLYQRI